ncbi:Phytochrome-like protein cph1 [Sedimentisphaera cyanobacteriorum]|uniref:histidine kinase n=1 Tax=Sedimentisphaera cyanobacteriorum TaxID=1940790 RepID=A0A1Q2HMU6_9BACT|nr:HAMP domain-containing histidine kinase [Sedimentisphaera cyanobacteriorum]AQQ08787.1 Phytochrome-like protein cph1 [Sedimentisphaera cyanobacteriorum]
MSIGSKIVLVVAFMIGINVIVDIGIHKVVSESTQVKSDRQNLEKYLMWYAGTIDNDRKRLRSTSQELGKLQAAASFIKSDGNEHKDFVSNIKEITSIENVVILNINAEVVYNSGSEEWREVFTENFIRDNNLNLNNPETRRYGLTETSEGMTLISAAPVISEGKVVGTVIVCELFGDKIASGISAKTGDKIEIVPQNKGPFSKEHEEGELDIRRKGGGKFIAHIALEGLGNSEKYALKIEVPSSIAARASTANKVNIFTKIVTGLVTLLLILFIVYRTIGQRLETLIDHIIKIRHSGVLVRMMQEEGKDEIDLLGHEFNLMIERLQKDTEMRKAAERDLKKSLDELRRFADVASHDLQEPLRSVTSCVQLLESQYSEKLDEQGKQLIDYAVQGSRRMKGLLKALLSYSNIGNTELETENCECNLIVAQAIKDLQQDINDKNADVKVSDLPAIKGDKMRLQLLFTNLIHNAITYQPEGRKPVIHIESRKTENMWRFEVRDNGIGIEKQYYNQIFIAFKRLHTQQEHEGSGIGLAICKRIVEQHGGKIWVKSEQGVGSSFFFSLPA